MGRRKIDAIGQRYGRLTIIDEAGFSQGKRNVLCRCDCGVECIVRFSCLRNGNTSSCGCLRKERASKRKRVHGESKTSLYRIYRTMLNHCYSDNDRSYHYFGGKGVKVCEEWRDDFVAFKEWAIENGYCEDEGMRICRENKAKDFSPENCYIAKTVTIRVQKQDNR